MKTAEQNRQAGARFRAKQREISTLLSGEGIKTGKTGLPKAAHPRRKAECSRSLATFARTYFPHVYTLPVSQGQLADFSTMQTAIERGGRYAFAAPRGDGKTCRVESAILWAALYGHRKCIVIVGADLSAATEILESIKLELRTNEILREDFPLPCWAAALAEDTALKAKGWTWNGVPLAMRWERNRIQLPVLDGADGNGCAIVPRGLTGRLRGMRLKVGKRAVRPGMYAIDDPQTDESAVSQAQVDYRERLILGAIMGSAGPDETLAAVMPLTIIKHNDLAARMLDRKRHPDWQGSARGLVVAWPDAQKTLWREYMKARREDSPAAANAFYAANQAAMDAGAVLDWPERYRKGEEISGLQFAENILCDIGEEAFAAEFQNAPKEQQASVFTLTPQIVASKVFQGRKRLEIPNDARLFVAATDLNHYGLHSAAISFGNDHTASVVWYDRFDNNGQGIVPQNCPEQEAKRRMFEALCAQGNILASLQFGYRGNPTHPGLWVIDGGYMPDVVRRFAEGPGRQFGITILPARGYSAEHYRPNGKNQVGHAREWCHKTESPVAGQFLAFCACYWREVSQRAWLGTPGAPGGLSLYEPHQIGITHREFSEQICREKLIEKIRGASGWFWHWHTSPGWHDYGDAVTMCYAGAAWAGIGTTSGMQATPPNAPQGTAQPQSGTFRRPGVARRPRRVCKTPIED